MLKLLNKIKNKIIPKHPLLIAHDEMTKSLAEGFHKGIKGEISNFTFLYCPNRANDVKSCMSSGGLPVKA